MKLADQEYKFKVGVRKLRQSHRYEPEKKGVSSEYDIYFSRDFKLGEWWNFAKEETYFPITN